MKTRTGFVSNSSSSSFIVIDETNKSKKYIPSLKNFDNELNVPEDFDGETEFGWQVKDYKDFGSKLNFCYLQCICDEMIYDYKLKEYIVKNRFDKYKRLEMLEEVLKECLNIYKINWNICEDYNKNDNIVYGYIDHASSAIEGRNLEMFESKESLKNFLFCEDSYIHNDNDNHL